MYEVFPATIYTFLFLLGTLLQNLTPTYAQNGPGGCQFPFIYEGVSYSTCTEVNHDQPWCSTETDDNDNYIGKWKNCEELTTEEELRTTTTIEELPTTTTIELTTEEELPTTTTIDGRQPQTTKSTIVASCAEGSFYCESGNAYYDYYYYYGDYYEYDGHYCIPKYWVCDNIQDCIDGEDEANCKLTTEEELLTTTTIEELPTTITIELPTTTTIEELPTTTTIEELPTTTTIDQELTTEEELPTTTTIEELPTTTTIDNNCDNQFQCLNGDCIPIVWICDGIIDCSEAEDEIDCDLYPCQDNQYRCVNGTVWGGYCIPDYWICDIIVDCIDGSDESNCSNPCYFNGQLYLTGQGIQNGCARFVCDGATGTFMYEGTDYYCPMCAVYLDPHIKTYSTYRSYVWLECGNYSLTQVVDDYDPTVAVFSTFVTCGERSDISCADTVTFKNDEHTVISLGYEDDQLKILVNNQKYIPTHTPTIVEINGIVYPLVVWKSYVFYENCVSVQGSSGILVDFCGTPYWANSVYVFTSSNVTAAGTKGLCGTANSNDFTSRNGTVYPWQKNPPKEFPLSWLSKVGGSSSCGTRNARGRRQIQNRCDNDSELLEEYTITCTNTVNEAFPNVKPEVAQTLIDDCVFDLCHVSNPSDWINSVQAEAKTQANIEEQALNCYIKGASYPQNYTRQGKCKRETCQAGVWVVDDSSTICIGNSTAQPTSQIPITKPAATTTTEKPTSPQNAEDVDIEVNIRQIVNWN